MAEWPGLAELKQRIDVTSDDWDGDEDPDADTRLSRLLATAIDWVKRKVGDWDEYEDEPTDNMAQSALERAVELATDAPSNPDTTPRSEDLLFGQRRTFGIG